MRYKSFVLLIVSVLIVCVSGIASASDTDTRVSPIASPLAAPAHQATIDQPHISGAYIWITWR